MFDEEESCKNSQLESPLALTGMDNIDQNTKQTNTQNGKQKEKDEMMIHNHEDIEKKKRNKISSQKEAAADASDAAATLLDQEKKESISTDLIQVEEGEGGDIPSTSPKKVITDFFKKEWQAFKLEKQKKLRQLPKEETTLDFDEMILEFKKKGRDPSRHWSEQAKKKEGEKCPELFTTILIGLFNLVFTCLIVLDYKAGGLLPQALALSALEGSG